MFKLPNTIQCGKCPWRKDVNPRDIPNGYCVQKHKDLEETIATPPCSTEDTIKMLGDDSPLKMMACHESENGHESPCIGWLNHQIGVGNNIKLRLHMLSCSNAHEIVLCGEQHENFEDTVPKPFENDYFNREDYDPSEHDYYF